MGKNSASKRSCRQAGMGWGKRSPRRTGQKAASTITPGVELFHTDCEASPFRPREEIGSARRVIAAWDGVRVLHLALHFGDVRGKSSSFEMLQIQPLRLPQVR